MIKPLLLLFLALGALTGSAQVKLQIQTNYYAVAGGTLPDIHRSLRQARPWRDAAGADGRTDWKIDYRAEMAGAPGGCQVSQVTVQARITITLPALQVPPGTDKEILRVWQTYLGKLMAHEQTHVGIAKSAAQDMLGRVRSAGSDRDCGALRARLNQVARQVLDECRKKQADYDRRTRHGVTEGVVLPRFLPGEEPRRRRRS